MYYKDIRGCAVTIRSKGFCFRLLTPRDVAVLISSRSSAAVPSPIDRRVPSVYLHGEWALTRIVYVEFYKLLRSFKRLYLALTALLILITGGAGGYRLWRENAYGVVIREWDV